MVTNKMLEEVWRWKDEVAKTTEKMSREEQIAYFRGAKERLSVKLKKEIKISAGVKKSQ